MQKIIDSVFDIIAFSNGIIYTRKKQFNLTDFLGRINHKATINEIKQEASRVKNLCCNSLNLLEDIEYRVEKKTADCVEIYLDRMVFDGIITKINVYVNIEVQ